MGLPCPYYSQGLLRQLQGLHALSPSRTPPQKKKKTSMKAEYNLGQAPGSDMRMVGGQEGHWLQPLSSVV